VVTVHAPPGFRVERFSLDVQAAFHNAGGNLEPQALLEGGGYGLLRLDGMVGEDPVRVLVLGEAPPPTPRAAQAPGGGLPELAIVLDDAGSSAAVVGELAALPVAIAVAVLPGAPFAAEVARGVRAQGKEILLHMPMEAESTHAVEQPAEVITVGLATREIRSRIERALAAVPGARGVNNHMGSKATSDRATMRDVMAALGGRGVYFLDSRTSADSVARDEAVKAGLQALQRDVFLDTVSERAAIEHALAQAAARAREEGRAVAIGHVHPLTIAVLEARLPSLASSVRLVKPSELAAR
jgi:hypothetical protein